MDEVFADEDALNEVLWSLTDRLGSVRDVAEYDDTTGQTTVINHLEYDAFGNLLSQTAPTTSPLLKFTGKYWDEDISSQYNWHRWLRNGRWLSEDPLGFGGGDVNLRRSVGNGPTNAVDASGLISQRMYMEDGAGHSVAAPTGRWMTWVLLPGVEIAEGAFYGCPTTTEEIIFSTAGAHPFIVIDGHGYGYVLNNNDETWGSGLVRTTDESTYPDIAGNKNFKGWGSTRSGPMMIPGFFNPDSFKEKLVEFIKKRKSRPGTYVVVGNNCYDFVRDAFNYAIDNAERYNGWR